MADSIVKYSDNLNVNLTGRNFLCVVHYTEKRK